MPNRKHATFGPLPSCVKHFAKTAGKSTTNSYEISDIFYVFVNNARSLDKGEKLI
jgi:hypothetical protein